MCCNVKQITGWRIAVKGDCNYVFCSERGFKPVRECKPIFTNTGTVEGSIGTVKRRQERGIKMGRIAGLDLDYTYRQANASNYGRSRDTKGIKYIVVHYTGNNGDTDTGNGNYFANNVVGTSAHYFVDNDSCTQAVADSRVAYHCETRGMKFKCDCRNANSIGVEMCTKKVNGTYYISEKTKLNAVKVVKWLMAKYNIPASKVIRHYDVCGKLCPEPWVRDIKEWQDFKSRLSKKAEETKKKEKKEETEMVTEGKAIVNGKEYKIDRILKDGNNYIKAGNFKNMGFDVGYDSNTKAVKITNSLSDVALNVKGNSKNIRGININGYNYVSVRDMVEALGFTVDYVDGKVIIK
nr:MAG TPA: N-acetylmuramoyl-L-alanine amidase [Caudoviricetes sp.]